MINTLFSTECVQILRNYFPKVSFTPNMHKSVLAITLDNACTKVC